MANAANTTTSDHDSSVRPDEKHIVGSESAFLAFSSMTIHGVAASRDGEQVPFILHRTISFPSRRFTVNFVTTCADEKDGWDAIPPPVGKPHLELELGERLGEGRIGIVYVARVVAVLDRPGGVRVVDGPRLLGVGTELVLKFVRPTNCRSLARETWFYEHLKEEEGFQGAVVPLCYGLFTASTELIQSSPSLAPVEIKPWIDKYGEDVPVDFTTEYEKKYGDELPDEEMSDQFYDDGRTGRAESPWCEWRPDPENPLLGVLVLERLGETYSREVFAEDHQSRKDIVDLIDDLSTVTVRHHDFRFNNVVRSRTSVVCPRHGYAHGWRVIDFDRSMRWGKTARRDDDFYTYHNRREYVRNDYKEFPVTFWTSLS